MRSASFFLLIAAVVAVPLGACDDGGGASGRHLDYIRGDRFTKLTLEVDAVSGLQPSASQWARIVSGLEGLLDKPGGITVVVETSLDADPDRVWTLDALHETADRLLDLRVDDATTKMQTLFVDGRWHEDTDDAKVLGLAFGGEHTVIFAQTISQRCRQVGLLAAGVCDATEATVWVHEIGHLLGLVDNGLAMVVDHRDPDEAHGRHDVSDDCVMHWTVNQGDVVDQILSRVIAGNEEPLGFDQACLDDIAAARDR